MHSLFMYCTSTIPSTGLLYTTFQEHEGYTGCSLLTRSHIHATSPKTRCAAGHRHGGGFSTASWIWRNTSWLTGRCPSFDRPVRRLFDSCRQAHLRKFHTREVKCLSLGLSVVLTDTADRGGHGHDVVDELQPSPG